MDFMLQNEFSIDFRQSQESRMLLPASNHRFPSEMQNLTWNDPKCHKDFQVELGNQIAGSFSPYFVNACPHAVHNSSDSNPNSWHDSLIPEKEHAKPERRIVNPFCRGTWFASNSKFRA